MSTEKIKLAKQFVENIQKAHPPKDGLLSILAKKDKELAQYYDLQDRFRQGFMLAEEMVIK